jgi:hypothetical protein
MPPVPAPPVPEEDGVPPVAVDAAAPPTPPDDGVPPAAAGGAPPTSSDDGSGVLDDRPQAANTSATPSVRAARFLTT